jgi:hypothetical protein
LKAIKEQNEQLQRESWARDQKAKIIDRIKVGTGAQGRLD